MNSRIPFVDLKQQYNNIKSEIFEAVNNVLKSTNFVLGTEVKRFEEEFALYTGTKYAICVNSGTSALHLALLACGVGPGDNVITVPFTFLATAAAIKYVGAKPVFVDIDNVTHNMNTDKLEEVINDKTKAIIPVHLYGLPANMERINAIARKYKLKVIEDAAQAHGALYRNSKVGSLGDIGCFSFYPSKNLGAYGEGGAVTTNNPDYANAISMMRNWGLDNQGSQVMDGYNYRMDSIQAAVLRVKLKYLDSWIEARRLKAAKYNNLFLNSNIKMPIESDESRHVYHIYGIQVQERDNLNKKLNGLGINTKIHYPVPIHLQATYKYLGYKSGDFPVSEKLAEQELSLPIYPDLSEPNQSYIVENILNI